MANHFPQVSFDWLGELPGIADEAARVRNERATLADLRSTNPDALEAKAAQLLAGGNTRTGLLLQDAALKRRALDQKDASDLNFREKILPLLMRGQQQAPGAAEPTPAAIADQLTPTKPESNFGPNPLATPGPQSALPSPSNDIIAQAQGGVVAPPQRTALAGPVPTPDSAPVAPAWLAGAQAVPPQPPEGTPPGPPAAAARPGVPTGQSPDDAMAEVRRLGGMLMMVPKNQPGALAAIRAQLQSALDKTKMGPEQKTWQFDMLQRKYEGEPVVPFSKWQLEQKVGPDTYKEVQGAYGKLRDKGANAESTLATLDVMDSIAKNPDFISGRAVPLRDRFLSGVASIVDVLRQGGVDPSQLPDMGQLKAMNSTKLTETYDALSKRLVLNNTGGSLGQGFSNADRDYMSGIFPALAMTAAGGELLRDIQRQVAKRDVAVSRIAQTYRSSRGVTANLPELDDRIQRYGDEHPLILNTDGTKTALGKKIDALIGQQGGTATPPLPAGALVGGGAQAPSAAAAPIPAPAAVPQTSTAQGRPALRENALVSGPNGEKYRVQGGQLVPLGGMGL